MDLKHVNRGKSRAGKKATKNKSQKQQGEVSVTIGHFHQPNPNHFPTKPRQFYTECKEVATWHNNLFKLGKIRDEPTIPNLDRNSTELRNNNTMDYKRQFLGANLYRGYEKHEQMTLQELDDTSACFQYYNQMISKSDIIIISPRHYIVDMIMSLFHDEGYSIICTQFEEGKILLSVDSETKQTQHDKNVMHKRILYSGIAFEKRLTHNNCKPYYSIVEATVANDTKFLLRCEMDAINEIEDTYTELKCFGAVNFHNIHHRRKMLKVWVQISLIPKSDLILGLRDQGGLLRDMMWFSRENLYVDLSNPSLPRNKRFRNFNPNVAVAWFHHCISHISGTITEKAGPPHKPESYRVVIDSNATIKIQKLTRVPERAFKAYGCQTL